LKQNMTPRSLPLVEKKRFPRCLGCYARRDATCDGDRRAETEADKSPCVYRDRCAGFKRHLEHKMMEVDHFLETKRVTDKDGEQRTYSFARMEDEDFNTLLVKGLKRWGIREGRATRRKPDDSVPARLGGRPRTVIHNPKVIERKVDHKKVARANAKVVVAECAEVAYKMCARFTHILCGVTGRNMQDVRGGTGVGHFFLVDKMATSRYITIYMRDEGGKKIPIAVLRPSARKEMCRVGLPATAETFREADAKRLGITDTADGAFKSKTREVSPAELAVVAEVIGKLIASGKIVLPVEQRSG